MAYVSSRGVQVYDSDLQELRDAAFDRAEQLAEQVASVEQVDARGVRARRAEPTRRALDAALNEVAACDLALARRAARRGNLAQLEVRLDVLAGQLGDLPDVEGDIAMRAVEEHNRLISEARARAGKMPEARGLPGWQ